MEQPIDNLRSERLAKLQKIKDLGINPYPSEPVKGVAIATIRDLENGRPKPGDFDVSGRVLGYRGHGKLIFLDLRDESGQIQLCLKADKIPADLFELVKLLDVGDFIHAHGSLFITTAGELSILVTELKLLNKSIRPLPPEHFGLKDTEERYRRRYLDLIINKDAKKILDIRWQMEKEIRKFLWDQKFTEVETPVLQSLYGGTNAKPFTTHFNALGKDFYLRVAPELYLKRLSIGGYERVFEIARNFRNEGIDHSHSPEFTMLEWYEAYADYQRVMDLAEALLKHLAKTILGTTKINIKGAAVEIGGKWARKTVDELVKEHLGIDWVSITEAEVKTLQEKLNVEVRGTWSRDKALFAIFDHEVTGKLVEPTWAIDYPIAVSPLSHEHRSKAGRAERFEGYLGGVEVFDGWSEIVSGIEQRSRFENEQKNMKAGDAEAMPLDEDFIEALEYGCPPLGGIGFGVDRLAMFLTDTWAIKEVIAFPTLKPKETREDDKS
ncbi:MAG: lysine--tRNA ligase [candidate division WWE3 bacterium]|nr:lysine--tRNA ligase [candidate division WWE3 bacterium]